LDDGNFQSQRDRVSADQWPCQRALHILPHQQQLSFDDRTERLRELGLPFNDLAADE
jgi:hypothetical protein